MNLIKQSEVVHIVRKSLDDALSSEQIGHINDMLIDATYKYSTGAGMDYVCIQGSDIPSAEDFPLQLLASMLASAGWKAAYKYCQKDGPWVHIDLPKVT